MTWWPSSESHGSQHGARGTAFLLRLNHSPPLRQCLTMRSSPSGSHRNTSLCVHALASLFCAPASRLICTLSCSFSNQFCDCPRPPQVVVILQAWEKEMLKELDFRVEAANLTQVKTRLCSRALSHWKRPIVSRGGRTRLIEVSTDHTGGGQH